ncbi:MAG: hypothetical protein QOK32_219 [Gaiellaceae bacterium]|nr:hypothetical protein [Gaiellaceae bacterium]
MTDPLRICIEARVDPGKAGGVVQGVLGLAHGLAQLEDGTEEYRFLVRPGHGDWLQPHLGQRSELLEAVRPAEPLPAPRLRTRVARGLRRRLDRGAPNAGELVAPTKGVAELWGARVVHFPTQQGFTTTIPTIYHPWDLQHVHLPEFFDDGDRRDRDLIYRSLCHQARVVVTPTRWGAEDVVANLDVPRRKLAVIPPAAPLTAYPEPTPEDFARVRAEYALPSEFVLYPAQTWPHKNHLALIDAVASLARAGTAVHVVCPGWKTEHYSALQGRLAETGVDGSFTFPDYVAGPDVAIMLRLTRALVFPSLFEGWGFPVLEAFAAGAPVACSSIPPLLEVAGPAALTFDPRRPDDLADALRRVWTDDGLRRELVERGRSRARDFTWERTARMSRAQYRRLAGSRLGEEDRTLIAEAAL